MLEIPNQVLDATVHKPGLKIAPQRLATSPRFWFVAARKMVRTSRLLTTLFAKPIRIPAAFKL
jgi:hypothetical protein